MSTDYKTPNSRFGATFLDTRYYDRAVNDEVMMSKESGEILYRDKNGKLIWYNRDKIVLNNFFFQIRESQKRHNWTIPVIEKEDYNNLFFTSCTNQLLGYYDFSNTSGSLLKGDSFDNKKKKEFSISNFVHGFLINIPLTSRDFSFAGILNSAYNNKYYNYSGDDASSKEEAKKFANLYYLESHFQVNYTVNFYDGKGIKLKSITTDAYVIANENTYVRIPGTEIYEEWEEPVSTKIVINSISAPKLAKGWELLHELPANDIRIKISGENDIRIETMNISYFVSTNDVNISLMGDEKNVNYLIFMGMYEFEKFMTKASLGRSGVMVSTHQPTEADWTESNIWTELMQKVELNDIVKFTGTSGITVGIIEEMIKGTMYQHSEFTFDITDPDNFFIRK